MFKLVLEKVEEPETKLLFWNFHSFCPLFLCLLWRCLFCLLLNKRALQVYSSRSFHSVCVCVCVCVCVRARVCTRAKSLQLCHTLCNPMDHSLPGSSNHGILQVRILEWVAMPSSRGFSWLRNQTHSLMSPALAGSSLPLASPGKPSFYSTLTQTLYICR